MSSFDSQLCSYSRCHPSMLSIESRASAALCVCTAWRTQHTPNLSQRNMHFPTDWLILICPHASRVRRAFVRASVFVCVCAWMYAARLRRRARTQRWMPRACIPVTHTHAAASLTHTRCRRRPYTIYESPRDAPRCWYVRAWGGEAHVCALFASLMG